MLAPAVRNPIPAFLLTAFLTFCYPYHWPQSVSTMSLLHSLTWSQKPLQEFRAIAEPRVASGAVHDISEDQVAEASAPKLPLYVFEWDKSIQDGAGIEIGGINSVADLAIRDLPQVRVV
jgi:hypothetical protein